MSIIAVFLRSIIGKKLVYFVESKHLQFCYEFIHFLSSYRMEKYLRLLFPVKAFILP